MEMAMAMEMKKVENEAFRSRQESWTSSDMLAVGSAGQMPA